MKEKFSKRVQTIIKQSKDEAIQLGHSYVGSEHILLGFLKMDSGLGRKILDLYSINIQEMTDSVKNMIKTSGGTITLGHLPLTRRAERIIGNTFNEASTRGSARADDEHLLLAMLKEPEGIASKILKSFSVDYETVSDLILTDDDSHLIDDLKDKESKVENSKTPTLDHFSRDITFLAIEGKLDPVIGRKNEIERVAQILTRRKKNNPVLIGEPGVGKTAIIEGLALRIVKRKIPRILYKKRILSLDLAAIVAGTKYRGQFEERLKSLMLELENNKNIIIFIDEIHTLVGAGGANGSLDASNMFKPSLARGDLHCIGATTLDEYRKHIEKDGALDRRLQKITVDSPSIEESISILEGLKEKYQDHHKVCYTRDAIQACVELSQRYITDKYLPDKAIDILDEAGARVHMYNFEVPKKIIDVENEIQKIKLEKNKKVSEQLFEEAAILRDKEKKLLKRLKHEQNKWNKDDQSTYEKIDSTIISDVVSQITGVPLSKITESESSRLLNLTNELGNHIIGQRHAIKSLTNAIKRSRTGLNNPSKPNGVFLFLGPTGVGKTQLAKCLAKYLFPSDKALIKIDMSEFTERFSLSRLIGAPPGYVGYDQGGELTERVRRNPYSVVLFDEIEKGHPDLFNILLQVFDEGNLTDGFGRKIDFKNTIIIMTSNIGTKNIDSDSFGFSDEDQKTNHDKMAKNIINHVRDMLSPELINRIDDQIVFNALEESDVNQIIDLQLSDLINNLKMLGYHIRINKTARKFILLKGYNKKYGARFLRRTIQETLENPISEILLKEKIPKGSTFIVKKIKNKIKFELRSNKSSKEFF